MTLKDYSKSRIIWTKHAAEEVLEDHFDPGEIERGLRRVVELPELDKDKKRGIIKLSNRYCTLIYVKMRFGLKIITCWESSVSDIKDYKNIIRGKNG